MPKRPALFTQTFSYNGETVILQGQLESITHLRQTLEIMKVYASSLRHAIDLLQRFVDNRDSYKISAHIEDADQFLATLDSLGKITAPKVTFTLIEGYESIINDLTEDIRKKEELLAMYRSQRAQQLSPCKEGEVYETPKGLFYIIKIQASNSKNIDYEIYGVRYSRGDTIEDIAAKSPKKLRPLPSWKKI